MSARVFNPVVMELRRAMRGGGAAADAGGLLGAAAAAAAVPATAEPCSQALARVRRNLFGPVDHEETRRFVERELALMSKRDEDLYEFDFVRERPREGPTRRFAWERVHPGGVPESYALRRLSFLGASTAAEAAPSEMEVPPPLAQPSDASTSTAAAATVEPAPAASETPSEPPAAAAPGQPAELPPCTPAPARTRQSHINDFMRSRKRPLSDGKAAAAAKTAASASKQRKSATSVATAGTTTASRS